MARVWQSGFELNSLTANVELTSLTGTGSIQTSIVRSGSYALRCNPTAATGFILKVLQASDQAIVGYARAYIYIVAYPDTVNNILTFQNSASANQGHLRLNPNGTLIIANSTQTQIGSATAALALNQWYMIELKNDATTSPGTLTGQLGGIQFASGANNVQGSWYQFRVGSASSGRTCDLYFDDIAVNDASGSFQNSWPGAGKIIHLKPDAAGDSSQWVPTSGANYTNVDEITPNDATDLVSDVVLNESDMYNVAGSGIGSMDTTNVVMVGVRFRNDVADATTQFKAQIEKASGGTISQSAAITPNSTTWKTNGLAAPFTYPIILYQDPDSINWTRDTLETMQIGQKSTLIGVNKNQVSAVWASVDYMPYYPKSLVMSQAMNRMATY